TRRDRRRRWWADGSCGDLPSRSSGALGDAELGRAGAGVVLKFFGPGLDRLAADQAEGRGPARRAFGQMARTGGGSAGALAQEQLDGAVFERMERDDREAAAGLEQPVGGGEAAGQLAQLVIHIDAQRLEGPGRRVDAVAAAGDDRADDAGERRGALDRRLAPG